MKKSKSLKYLIKLFLKINWLKTLYINFKTLPFKKAKKLPIVVFGRCKFGETSGKITIENDVYFGKIGIGQQYQIFKKGSGKAEFHILGNLIFKGRFQFGIDSNVFIGKHGTCTLGDMASLGGDSTLICTKKITFGDYCRIGTQAYISDSNFHNLKNPITNEVYSMSSDINLGNYNFISTRVSIMGKTLTADNTIVASNTLLLKDYKIHGENIILGGIPAKVVKTNINRDWHGEQKDLETFLKIL